MRLASSGTGATAILGVAVALVAACGGVEVADGPADQPREATSGVDPSEASTAPVEVAGTEPASGAPEGRDSDAASVAPSTTAAVPSQPGSSAPPDETTPPAGGAETVTRDEVGVERLFLTEEDDGRRYAITTDGRVEVRLDGDGGWTVEAEGPATVVPTSSFDDTGQAVWEIRLDGPGTVVLRATSADGTRLQFTLEVRSA